MNRPTHPSGSAEGGFIPMLIMLLLMLVLVMAFAFRKVLQAQH